MRLRLPLFIWMWEGFSSMGEAIARERAAHARARLLAEEDAWLASASVDGMPYLVPLSYYWDGQSMVFATLEKSVTLRNLRRNGRTRAGLPDTRDVVLVEGEISFLDAGTELATIEAFAARLKWDPRREPQPYVYFRLRPVRVQTWQTAEDLPTRDAMRDGRWLDEGTDGGS